MTQRTLDSAQASYKLTLLQFHVGLQRRGSVGCIRHFGHFDGGRATEKVDLLSQYFGVLQLLGQVVVHFLGDRVVLGPLNRCGVLDVLDNRLILGAQIFV